MNRNPENQIHDTFVGVVFEGFSFPVITVYQNPADYPDKYVARLSDAHSGPTVHMLLKDSLEEIREAIPKIFYRQDRDPLDDPRIIETWI